MGNWKKKKDIMAVYDRMVKLLIYNLLLHHVCIGEVQVSITPGHEGVLHIDPGARVVLNCTVTGLPPGDTGNTSWHIPIPDLLRKNSVKIRREGYHSLILELSSFKIHMEGTYVCLSQHHDLFSHIKLEMKNRLDGSALKISPPNPIRALVGSTVHLNCSIPPYANFDLKWMYPPAMEGRVQLRRMFPNILRFSIHKLEANDQGLLTCKSQYYGIKSVPLSLIYLQVNIKSRYTCGPKHFKCWSGHCIFKRYRCDRMINCPDASDEISCPFGCFRQFRCDNGKCISPQLVCDRFRSNDCMDNSDERYCNNRGVHYTEIAVNGDKIAESPPSPSKQQNDHTMAWLMSTIYSVMGVTVGLVCLLSIMVIIMCRIRIKREATRSLTRRLHDNDRRHRRPIWHYSSPFNLRPEVGELIPGSRNARSRNLAVNINLQLGEGPEGVFMSPPPYTESEEANPEGDVPPPPYSTLDRPARQPRSEQTTTSTSAGRATPDREANSEPVNEGQPATDERSERIGQSRVSGLRYDAAAQQVYLQTTETNNAIATNEQIADITPSASQQTNQDNNQSSLLAVSNTAEPRLNRPMTNTVSNSSQGCINLDSGLVENDDNNTLLANQSPELRMPTDNNHSSEDIIRDASLDSDRSIVGNVAVNSNASRTSCGEDTVTSSRPHEQSTDETNEPLLQEEQQERHETSLLNEPLVS